MAMQNNDVNLRDTWCADKRRESIIEFVVALKIGLMKTYRRNGFTIFSRSNHSKRKPIEQAIWDEFFEKVPGSKFTPFDIQEGLFYLGDPMIYEINITQMMKALSPSEPTMSFLKLGKLISGGPIYECTSTLVINTASNEYEVKPPLITDEVFNVLCKMKALKNLEINKYGFNLDKLQELCRLTPSLTRVQIILETKFQYDDEQQTESLKENLKNLEWFLFVAYFPDDNFFRDVFAELELTFFCMQQMPQLQYVGNMNCLPSMINICKERSEKSCLKHLKLHLTDDMLFPNSFEHFPDVESLSITWSQVNYHRIDSMNLFGLSKVTALELKNLYWTPEFELFIFAFGRKLNLLTMSYFDDNTDFNVVLDLELIAKRCTVLKTLELLNIHNLYDYSTRKMLELTHLKLTMMQSNKLDNISLWRLLKAPKLRIVQVEDILIDRKDYWKSYRLTVKGQILKKILHFSLDCCLKDSKIAPYEPVGDEAKKWEDDFRKTRPLAYISIIVRKVATQPPTPPPEVNESK